MTTKESSSFLRVQEDIEGELSAREELTLREAITAKTKKKISKNQLEKAIKERKVLLRKKEKLEDSLSTSKEYQKLQKVVRLLDEQECVLVEGTKLHGHYNSPRKASEKHTFKFQNFILRISTSKSTSWQTVANGYFEATFNPKNGGVFKQIVLENTKITPTYLHK